MVEPTRCSWATSAPEYLAYHDTEWGVPLHGDDALFERMSPGGVPVRAELDHHPAQAASTSAPHSPASASNVAAFDERDVERLMADAGSCATARRSRRRSTTPGRPRPCPRGWTRCCGRSPHRRPAGAAGGSAAWRRHPNPWRWPRSSRGGVSLHRPDDRLRADAGDRNGRRPRSGVLAVGCHELTNQLAVHPMCSPGDKPCQDGEVTPRTRPRPTSSTVLMGAPGR